MPHFTMKNIQVIDKSYTSFLSSGRGRRRGRSGRHGIKRTHRHTVSRELPEPVQRQLGGRPAVNCGGLRVVAGRGAGNHLEPGHRVAEQLAVPGLARGRLPIDVQLTGPARLELEI